uniref:Uncharacterized protein n=1 Tax=viral metagenome TaxID=1070528 RepID=A0A6H1ZMU5_9ZZZZ
MVNFLSPETIDVIKDGEPLQEREIAEYSEVEEVIETGIAKRDPFNPEQLINLLRGYIVEIDVMVSKATDIKVFDDSSMEIASDMANQGKALVSVVSKKHAELKRPYLDVTQPLDDFKKKITDRVTLCIVKPLENKILPYMQMKRRAAEEEARKAAAEAARIQAELDAKAEAERVAAAEAARQSAIDAGMTKREADAEAMAAAAMVEAAPVVVAQVVEETKVQTETGSAKLKEKLVGELIDIRLVPDACIQSRWEELKKAVQPYINAQIAAGARNVPGFKIYKTAQVSTRVSRGAF